MIQEMSSVRKREYSVIYFSIGAVIGIREHGSGMVLIDVYEKNCYKRFFLSHHLSLVKT